MTDRQKDVEGKVIEILSKIFPRESIGDKFEDRVVSLDDSELALVTAWISSIDVTDTLAPNGSIVDRAFIGALFMLEAIHDDDEVAGAVARRPPLEVWRKFVGNFLLTLARGEKSLLTTPSLPALPPPIDREVRTLPDNAAKRLILDAALIITEAVVKGEGWWDRQLAPLAAAIVTAEMCRIHPPLLHLARRFPAMSIIRDAIVNYAAEVNRNRRGVS